jgi:hypothetical protein
MYRKRYFADSNNIWKNFECNKNYSIIHHFGARSAWENLALETSSRGLVSHGMQGFDYEKARVDLEIPDNFVMIMIAIGKKGPKKNLPLQLQEKERPDDRILLKEIIMKDNFKNKFFLCYLHILLAYVIAVKKFGDILAA